MMISCHPAEQVLQASIAYVKKCTSGLALHKFTWTLLVFSALNFCGVDLLIKLLAPPDFHTTSATYVDWFLHDHAYADSWGPMRIALEKARIEPKGSIYQTIFFQQKVKFQYPPSSLLAVELMDRVFGRRTPLKVLNGISWLCVTTLAVIVPCIYILTLKKFSPGMFSRFGTADIRIQAVLFGLLTMSFYPVTRGFVIGQIQTWLTCLFAGAVLAWIGCYMTIAGVLIGLIVSVKPQLGLLLLWSVCHGNRRFLVGSITTVIALEGISLWHYGLTNQMTYLSVLSFMSLHGESFYPNQSVNGLLARSLHVGNNLQWKAQEFAPFNSLVYSGTVVSSCFMIMFALFWHWKRRDEKATLVKFLVASLLFTMASPIAWEHHYGILATIYAVLVAILLEDYPERKWLAWTGASYAIASNCFLLTNLAADTPWNFLQSYLLAAAALLLFLLCLHERRGRPVTLSPLPSTARPRLL